MLFYHVRIDKYNKSTMSSNTTSVYIPRVSKAYEYDMIVNRINTHLLVNTYRIDFVEIQDNDHLQSVFVHFEYDYNGYFAQCVLPQIIAKIEDESKPSYRLNLSEYEFWWVLPNLNPVQETNLNIHQIAENARLLESRVELLETMLSHQNNQINYLKSLVYPPYSYNYSDRRIDYRAQEEEYDDSEPDLLTVEDLQEEEDDDYADMPPLIAM